MKGGWGASSPGLRSRPPPALLQSRRDPCDGALLSESNHAPGLENPAPTCTPGVLKTQHPPPHPGV